MSKNPEAGRLVIEAIKKYKNSGASKAGIARELFEKHPLHFASVENARSLIRTYTGNNGEKARNAVKNQYDLRKLPESHAETWEPYTIRKHKRILCLSDIHFPYHTPQALDLAIKYGQKNGATLCLLNGDTLDMFNMSVYDKDPDKPGIALEFEMGKDFIKLMRKTFGAVLFKVGNHEERWQRWLQKNPAIFGLPDLQLDHILQLEKNEYVTDKRIIKAGKLNILHGHEFGGFMSNPVNFARTISLKMGESTIAGHCHQTSEQPLVRPGSKAIATCWSQGCLSELHPQYRPINQWNHGFSFINVESNGNFEVENKRIYEGKIL